MQPASVAFPRQIFYETRYSQYTHVTDLSLSLQEMPSEISRTPLPIVSELTASPYSMSTLPAGAHMPGYFHSMHEGSENNLAMDMNNRETPPAQLNSYDYKSLQEHYKRGTASDLSVFHLPSTTSGTSQGGAGACVPSPHVPSENATQKREIRLMKNREAARECRRKKKEYLKCLENRVEALEHQNKTLIDELRAIKEIYPHK